MAYVEPTTADLILRFPEFSVVADARLDLFLQEAIIEVDDTWLDMDRARAQILLAAHNLSIAGEPSASGGASSSSGPVESASIGDVSVTYRNWGFGSTTAYAPSIYSETRFGSEYELLLQRNHGGPRVI